MKGFIKGINKAEGSHFNFDGVYYFIGPIMWDDGGYYLFQLYSKYGQSYFIRFYKDKMVWYQDGNYIDTFMLILTDYETTGLFVKKLQSELNYIKRKGI